ncbi:hypothetical protein SAMN05661012_04164 [Chitinophaga sancti]|uniref:Uncharacterized protein n=1 Tax=Chitinophaga sancti TaxID=1004 RepID=A0A1K1RRJ5_9BACT|nr:hypothetical protein SAMN05661012_04164 [Chitinophaga sancti]
MLKCHFGLLNRHFGLMSRRNRKTKHKVAARRSANAGFNAIRNVLMALYGVKQFAGKITCFTSKWDFGYSF